MQDSSVNVFGFGGYYTMVEVSHLTEGKKHETLSPKARPIVFKLSALFSIDAFGGGFIGQSILSYYFYTRFALDLSTLGEIFFATQIVTALSFLLAERIARRIGLLRTMVFSHIPSNVFLTAVAFAPTPLSASLVQTFLVSDGRTS